ncbi:T9SS-dependent M36 family metallopeptidase [Aquimarina sp. 2201CG5-10]|uniref:T9SS-dependent M36 family metallopeptidase n=1 Tax=Aquimarina callyspongiae TaxID=3098150 RepID=UPI002AB3FEAD|nr:T9SS-dependent M36 family metallopeptidase [Aquimarina sp. 2201CG5-10]MDY8136861.1 T9SS-dependent M36 family metallopeptidase [Aquimarina sp. 2201CG5-10]
MKQFYLKLFMVLLGLNLTFAQSSEIDVIQKYLVDSGMDAKDVNDLSIKSQAFSKSMNVTTMYVEQLYQGIPVRNAIGSFALKDGQVVSYAGKYIQNISSKVTTTSTTLSPEDAITSASIALNLGVANGVAMISKKEGENNSFIFSKGNISTDDIPVKLVYELKEGRLLLCWDLSIHTKDGKNWYSVRIDANNGSLQSQNDWIISCSFGTHAHNNKRKVNNTSLLEYKSETPSLLMDPVYNVYPVPAVESPNHGSRQLVSGTEDATASPFGWHDTNGVAGAEATTTQGNNVLAAEDLDGNDAPGSQPDGGANLVFDYPFDPTATISTYQNASLTNLFYVSNVTHDVWYHYGFDEASGNFQVNNYGNGGSESDEVLADGQDGSGFNNANFGTPPDGFNPRMQMFLWNVETLVFTINNTTLAGEYVVTDNTFNPGTPDPPTLPDGITADLVLAIDDNATPDPNDACSALTNAADISGKIAVVRRGECNFVDKVIRCQQAGALAVIIVNNAPGGFVPAGNGPANRPTIGINQADGEAIITQMASETVSATLASIQPENWIAQADGSFDNGIIVHEYGHGISTRLSGGAATSGCLSGEEQMGEGWSDWFGLMMTIEAGDTGADARGIGTYAIGQPVTGGGIRPFPYSNDMNINPVTYGSISDASTFSVPHGVGSVWGSIIWDLTWALIDRDGFDSDLYNGTGGNNTAMQLIIDGLKLQSCSPGFVDGRDGILAAADLLPNSTANKCLIWEVFARRGVGFSADQGTSGSRSDQTEAFDLPPTGTLDCTLGVDDVNAGIFSITPNPSRGVFNIRASQNVGDSAISIFDMNGRVVFKQDAQIGNLHRVETDLGSGIYLIRIEAKDGSAISTSKIVIN